MTEEHARLIDLPVHAFVEAVGSTQQAVPAGGSVAALTGALSAALLALVCGVLQRRAAAAHADWRIEAEHLQRELLVLVDEDAEAFRAFLQAKRVKSDLGPAIARTSRVPLRIAEGCARVVDLSLTVEASMSGLLLGDVRAAGYLAEGALRTALDIADQNVEMHQDARERQALREAISRLRARPARSER